LIEDADLMKRTAGGDGEAFRILVERYSGPLYNFFFRSTGSREDSEDLLQNLFSALFRTAERYRRTASFRTYIYRIASNMLVSYYRKQKDSVPIGVTGRNAGRHEYPDSSPGSDPGKNAEAAQLEERFREALAELPTETAAALELRVREGFKYREISEILGKSISAVESMIFRGRISLAEKLEDFIDHGREEKK
jgi:RNA polymerase sigma-70 factor (ECF subfamily)